MIETVLGDVREVDARTELLWPEIEIVGTGETSVRDIPDHLDMVARTSGGGPVSVQVLAGVAPEDPEFSFRIRGSEGWLELTGNHPAGVKVGDLTLTSGVAFAAPDAPVANGTAPTADPIWTCASINVGEAYASLARDLAAGTHHTPGFPHALHNSRLVAAVARAAETGRRQTIAAQG